MTTAIRPAEGLSGAQLATAFDGTLERTGLSLGYRLGVLLVAGVMVLLPLIYLAIVVGAAWGVFWYATHATAMFAHVRGRGAFLVLVVYLAPIIAGGMLVIFMLLPLLWRSSRDPKPYYVDRREQPLLYAYVDRLCDAMRVPRPARIDITAAANASAHIDNGLLGLFRRRLVLTIGLPLAATLDLRQFTGVLAHEFGHFAQGSSMRLSYIVGSINRWFARMAFGRSGIDDALDRITGDDEVHWAVALVVLLTRLIMFLTRLVLMGLAVVSQALSMHLSRQAEFDADRKAARIVGSEPMGQALEQVPHVALASEGATARAQKAWARRQLPDDLVALTAHLARTLPEQARSAIVAEVLSRDASWFDTHPPLFKRVAALKKAAFKGVMKLNASPTLLFKDFDELAKIATMDLYQANLGDRLKPEHIYPTVLPGA